MPNGLSLNKKPERRHAMNEGLSGGLRPMLPHWAAAWRRDPRTSVNGEAGAETRRAIGDDIGVAVKLLLRFLGLSVRGGHDPVHRRRRRGRRPAVAFLQGSAGLFAAAGLRAAGDDARACRRRLAARRICQGAPALSADPGDAEARHQRLRRGRGQEFLPASRHRHLRHRARRRCSMSRTTAAAAIRRAPRPSPSRSPRTSC